MLNYDNDRIEKALAALNECNEGEALAAWFAWNRVNKTTRPGRPRGKGKGKESPIMKTVPLMPNEVDVTRGLKGLV